MGWRKVAAVCFALAFCVAVPFSGPLLDATPGWLFLLELFAGMGAGAAWVWGWLR